MIWPEDVRPALSALLRTSAGRRVELIGGLSPAVAEACWVVVRTFGDEARHTEPMGPEDLGRWLERLAAMDVRAAAALLLRAAGLRWKAIERHVGVTRQWLVRLIADGEGAVRQPVAAKDVARLAQVGIMTVT